MSQALRPFPDIGASETVARSFDFADGLATGETLTGVASCEIAVHAGTDADVADRLIAGPTIDGTEVSVLIGTMLDGVAYQVRCDVSTTGGQLLSLWTIQKCVGP